MVMMMMNTRLRQPIRVMLILMVLLAVAAAGGGGTLGGNSSEAHDDSHNSISLISWRWTEYDSIFYFTLIILLTSLLKIGFHHTPKLADHFPESCVLIIFGIAMGCVVHFCFEDGSHTFPKFTNTLFFNVLLPPIVLDASYSMYDEDFFGNLDAILMLAVLGTVFNVFLIALLLFGVCSVGLLQFSTGTAISFTQCLVFASIIAAVDPVAVLAIFEEIHVNSVLYFLVFGESLLNDGVTIVLYNTMTVLSLQEKTDFFQYVLAFVSFFTVVFGGLIIGVCMGVANAIILRLTKKDHIRVLEPLVIVTSAYFSYIMAELLHWSGIISLIGCGIVQKRYAFLNASQKTYTTVKYTVKTVASVADCVIFIFLGKVAVKMFVELEFHPGFICFSLLFATLVRVAGVFLLSYLTNMRRMKPISFREQLIMAYGGLRGAVSFSLAYILDDANPMKPIFLTTTLLVIFFTVFIQGGTIKILVNKLHISKAAEKDKKHIFCDVHKKTTDYLMTGMEAILGNISIGSYLKIIQTFDERYVKKLLVRKRVIDKMTMRLEKITLDEHFARLYGPTVLVIQQEEEKMAAAEQEEMMKDEQQPPKPSSRRGSRVIIEPPMEGMKRLRAGTSVRVRPGSVRYRPRRKSVDQLRLDLPSVIMESSEENPPIVTSTSTTAIQRISTEKCLVSLNNAFMSNPYEKYKRKDQDSELPEENGDFQVRVLAQLHARSKQTRDIERRLMRVDTFEDDEEDEDDALTVSAGAAAAEEANDDDELENSDELSDLLSPIKSIKSDPDESVPMLPMLQPQASQRRRASSGMTAGEVRQQYLMAKRRFKSFQQ